MPDIVVNFSTAKAIDEYIDRHTLPQIGKMIAQFKDFKRKNPMGQYSSQDKDSKGVLSEYRHWKTGINDIDLWYKVLRNGNFYRIVLIDLATHNESGTLGGGNRQDSYSKRLKTIFNGLMLNMNKPSKRILPLNNSYKQPGIPTMKIITESTAPVSIQEAKTKASLYATAWGHKEVSLTLFEKFALVEAIEGDKGEFAKIAFAINWPKTQKFNTIEKTVMKCMTSTGDEVDMDMVIFNYEDISDVKVTDNLYAFKMHESVIFLEGTMGKTKKVAKTCAAALASSMGKSKMDIHMVESNAMVNEYKKVKSVDGKLITLESIQDGKVINEVSGLSESNITKIADKNILGCILEGVMVVSEKASQTKIVSGVKDTVKSVAARYVSKRTKPLVEEVEDDAYESWQEEVVSKNPELKGKIKFVNKNDHNGKLVVSAQVGDRSLGVYDLDTNKGELLGEGTNIPAKNLLGSFRGSDGKTYTYGSTKNKWAIKHGLEHEIESGSKLEQNKFGNVKGNVAHIANTLDESGTPSLTKMTIRHIWKNEATQNIKPVSAIDAGAADTAIRGQELDEAVASFVVEYEIKDQEKTTQGKVTYQAKDQNEAKQRFLDDHEGDGQVTVKSVTAALAEDLGVTDSAIGVTNDSDSRYVVYTDVNGRKVKKIKHGTNEEITEELEKSGCKVHSIQGQKVEASNPMDESLDPSEMDKIIKDALDKSYVTATKAKEQYDRTYTDPDDEPFDFDDALSDAFESELQSIMDQLDDAINDVDDKVDGYMAGKVNESVILEETKPVIKTRQHHYAEFMTKFFGKEYV